MECERLYLLRVPPPPLLPRPLERESDRLREREREWRPPSRPPRPRRPRREREEEEREEEEEEEEEEWLEDVRRLLERQTHTGMLGRPLLAHRTLEVRQSQKK